MHELKKIRRKIDLIDGKIGVLLKKREQAVSLIKKLKIKAKLPNIDKAREAEILQKFDSKYQKAIFRKILSESRKILSRTLELI